MFIAVIFSMMAAGVFAFFFLDVTNRKTSGDIIEISDINSLIDNEDMNVKSLITRVANGCSNDDKECIAVKTYRYIKENVALGEAAMTGYSAYGALTERQGDAIDLSLLYASMLANIKIDARIEYEDGKPYVYVGGLDAVKLYDTIMNDIRSTPLASRELLLKEDQIWAVNLSDGLNIPMSIDIVVKSNKPFDMSLFANMEEVNRYFSNNNGIMLQTCNKASTTAVNQTCLVPANSVLVFVSHDADNKFNASVYKGGLIPNDISEKVIDGRTYIPADMALNALFQYPGIMQ